MPPQGSDPSRGKRVYGASCLVCREKKIKCNGERPTCKGCKDTKEKCSYPSTNRQFRKHRQASATSRDSEISVTSFRALQETVEALTDKVSRLEQRLGSESYSRQSRQSTEVTSVLETPGRDVLLHNGEGSGSLHPEGLKPQLSTPLNDASSVPGHLTPKFSLNGDSNGNVVYHGLTSIVQQEGVIDLDTSNPAGPTTAGHIHPAFSPFFHALSGSRLVSASSEIGIALLDCFFNWHILAVVDRSMFLRDMVLDGPFFSEFLLVCMYTNANRIFDGLDEQQRRAQGVIFTRLARDLLSKELEGVSKITTVQGLILLSGHECGEGNVSQGWNYAGMAFRMLHDLGIHLDPSSVAGTLNLSEAALIMRDRVFWSAFVWDKMLSLALGREPSFNPTVGRDPSTLPDLPNDQDGWRPYFWNHVNCPPPLKDYLYRPMRKMQAFRMLADLSLILHDLIVQIYSANHVSVQRLDTAFLNRTEIRLTSLRRTIPSDFETLPPGGSHPPWVFTALMLYHASWILLHRPFLGDNEMVTADSSIETCIVHSTTACDLVQRYCAIFAYKLPYAALYASIVAASFDVSLLRHQSATVRLAATTRVRTWLYELELIVGGAAVNGRAVRKLQASAAAMLSTSAADSGLWSGGIASGLSSTLTDTMTQYGSQLSDMPDSIDFFDLITAGYGDP